MCNSLFKRIVAGVMSVLTISSYIPYSIPAAATKTPQQMNFADYDAKEFLELLQYFETVGTDVTRPPIMISEGDLVMIGDTVVSDTVVPVTRALIENQDKIRSKYWLNTLEVGTYEELQAADAALKTYFNTAAVTYNNAKSQLRTQLIALRDYCISHDLTANAMWEDAEKYKAVTTELNQLLAAYGEATTAYAEDNSEYVSSKSFKKEDEIKEQIGVCKTWWDWEKGWQTEYYEPEDNKQADGSTSEGSVANNTVYTSYTEPSSASVYVAADENWDWTGVKPASAEEVLAKARENYSNDADLENKVWYAYMCEAAGLKPFFDTIDLAAIGAYEDYCNLASSLNTLIGDTTVNSADFVDKQLANMGVEEMLYAYVAFYTNLARVNKNYAPEMYELYVLLNASDTTISEFVPISELTEFVHGMPETQDA